MRIFTNFYLRKYSEIYLRPILSFSMVLLLMLFSTGIAQAFSESDVQSIHNGTEFYDPAAAGQTSTGCNTAGGCTCSTVTLTGSTDLEQEWNFFIAQGLTTSQTAGIIGNMRAESYFNPEQLENNAPGVNTPYTELTAAQINDINLGWGIVQWTPSSKFIDPTLAANGDPNDLGTQLNYLWGELTGNDAGVLANIKMTTTPQAAADVFVSQFEIPYDIKGDEPGREAYAEAYYQYFVNNVALPPALQSSTTAGSGDCSSGPPTSGGSGGTGTYRNPLRSVVDLGPNRIDQGVDYTGSGPVYAIGNGVVDNLVNSGWDFGGYDAFLTYQLSDGPAQGLYVYVAEDCIPQVTIGQQVTSDTVICTINNPSGSGIETGWAVPPGNGVALGKSEFNGKNSTAYGINFSQLLVSLGTPGGVLQNFGPPGTLPTTWPQW